MGVGLQKDVGYFANNKCCMVYLAMCNAGLPIGSDMVESGVKQFKTHVACVGMRWSRAGSENIFSVRIVVLSGQGAFRRSVSTCLRR